MPLDPGGAASFGSSDRKLGGAVAPADFGPLEPSPKGDLLRVELASADKGPRLVGVVRPFGTASWICGRTDLAVGGTPFMGGAGWDAGVEPPEVERVRRGSEARGGGF